MIVERLAFSASLLLIACGGNSPPQASSAPRNDLGEELVTVDTRLKELAKEVEAARDDVKADLTQQLDALQKRDDELKGRLHTTEASAGADAEKARREIHGAIVDLEKRMQGVADRLQR